MRAPCRDTKHKTTGSSQGDASCPSHLGLLHWLTREEHLLSLRRLCRPSHAYNTPAYDVCPVDNSGKSGTKAAR